MGGVGLGVCSKVANDVAVVARAERRERRHIQCLGQKMGRAIRKQGQRPARVIASRIASYGASGSSSGSPNMLGSISGWGVGGAAAALALGFTSSSSISNLSPAFGGMLGELPAYP